MSSSALPSWATPRSPERRTYGPALGRVSEALGRPLMPWQQQVADVALEVLPDGRWAYPTVVVTVPRQAGKTTLVQAVLAHRGQLLQGGSLWLTAQNRDKARKRWMDLTDELIVKLPGTLKRNIGVSHEVLRWSRTGSKLFPFAPNPEAMHGESPDLVAPDEIWAFTAEQAAELQQAYLPGMITKNAQEFITSTQGTDESEWLNELTESGRASVDEGIRSGVAYFEFSIPPEVDGLPVTKLDDERLLDVICAHHPALGHTITREALAYHLTRFRGDREGFIRGYGNLRIGSTRPRVIPAAVWDEARTDLPVPGLVGVGVSVDADGQQAAIVAAGRTEAGQAVVEVVQTSQGWLLDLEGRQVSPVEYVQAMLARGGVDQVAVLTSGAGRDLADQLEAADVEVLKVGPADYAAACGRWRNGVKELTVLHRDQPSLNEAMRTVGQRKVAGGLGWAGKGATVADAGSLAVWAADHPGEQPGAFRIY